MRRLLFTILATITAAAVLAQQQHPVIHFVNGQWFDGKSFSKGSYYAANGILTTATPQRVDSTVDLKGQFVIPPFGEAHNHAPDVPEELPVYIERYLADGIFYIKNPNSIPYTTNRIKDRINHPHSVDVVFANGGITAPGGHPTVLYEYMLQTLYKKSLSGWTKNSLEGTAYYTISDEAELERKWPFILADKPGFIKVYLLFSEEFEERKNDTSFNGYKGLNPTLLPLVVQKAKAAGLTVSCHVETPTDLKTALRAGVTEINHLPGYRIRWKEGYQPQYYRIKPRLARLMKKKKIHTDVTFSLGETEIIETDSLQYKLRKDVQIANLQLLKRFGVAVTVGCDSYNLTARTEINYLHSLGIYSNLELLKMWSETTPQAIFPARKIATLKEGYEASFLVLKENPLQQFDALFNISLRVKQGHILW